MGCPCPRSQPRLGRLMRLLSAVQSAFPSSTRPPSRLPFSWHSCFDFDVSLCPFCYLLQIRTCSCWSDVRCSVPPGISSCGSVCPLHTGLISVCFCSHLHSVCPLHDLLPFVLCFHLVLSPGFQRTLCSFLLVRLWTLHMLGASVGPGILQGLGTHRKENEF